jgi:hypothetical protein
MKRIAISIFHERVASRLDSAENLLLVTTNDKEILSRELVLLREEDPIKKIEKIVQLRPDVLICGGLTKICERKLSNSNVKVFPWIQGSTEYILSLCLKNKFVEGAYDRIDYKPQPQSHL